MELPAHSLSRDSALPKRPSLWNGRSRWLIIFVIALLWSAAQAGLFSGAALVNSGGWAQFTAFWQAAFQPVLTPDFLAITLQATLVTLAYAVTGTFFSLLIGGLFALLASEVWWESVWPHHKELRRVPWAIIRGLLAIPRGIHELIWGLFFLNIFGLDPLVAILAIAIPFGATVAKVFAEMLDETGKRPYLTLLNSGTSPLKAMLYTLLPLALPDLLSYSFYRFECAIRAAAILGIVGAGGLGYQILLSMQTLNYNETWTLFYALMLLSGLVDAWSAQVRQRLGRTDVAYGNLGGKQGKLPSPGHFDNVLRGSIIAVLLLVPLSFWYLNPSWNLLWADRSAMLLRDITRQAWPLNLTWADVQKLWQLSAATFAMSILAAVIAAIGGALLSFPAARPFSQPNGRLRKKTDKQMGDTANKSKISQIFFLFSSALSAPSAVYLNTAVSTLTRIFLLLMRAIPAPIWALVMLFIFFPGMWPGAIALAIYNMGILGRLMAEVTENQDKRPSQAIRAMGTKGGAVFLYGIVPAVTPRYTAYSLYRWENIIRETVVVGLVGAGGLGRELSQQLSAFNYRAVIAVLICLIALTFVVDMISTAVRKTLR